MVQGPRRAIAGVTWDVNDRLTLDFEYSSDAYVVETGGGLRTGTSKAIIERRSPFNFGATYRFGRPGRAVGILHVRVGNRCAAQLLAEPV